MATTFSVKQIRAGNCFSYILASDTQAVLIDPHITKVQTYRDHLRKARLTLTAVIDTHTHADHLSSAAVISREYNCPIMMSEKAVSSLKIRRLGDCDTVTFGEARLEVRSAPGHTDDSIALIGGGSVFTGDVLLIGSVGRIDFQNGSPEDMFDTLTTLKQLPDETVVFPAHDYNRNTRSTIGDEKAKNPFMQEADRGAFIAKAKSKVLPKPFNMDAIIRSNSEGLARNIQLLSPAQTHERLASADEKWRILDVRRPDEYRAIRIEQSTHIPLDALGGRTQEVLETDEKFILSCQSGARAMMAASILMAAGVDNVYVLEGGLSGWLADSGDVVREKVPISLERQVRAIAGGLVLVGSLLAFLISPWFLLIPLWVGAGLLFAGLTNSCLMGMLLMKLPYNRRALQSQSPVGGTCSLDGGGGSCAM